MSTFSSDIGHEEEDGAGWSGLAPTKHELREEARQEAQSKDAARWRFLAKHWNSTITGLPLHQWIDEQAIRRGGLAGALDYAIRFHHNSERHIA